MFKDTLGTGKGGRLWIAGREWCCKYR